eukprot:2995720-Pleurochrysis_carterae.AAC.1
MDAARGEVACVTATRRTLGRRVRINSCSAEVVTNVLTRHLRPQSYQSFAQLIQPPTDLCMAKWTSRPASAHDTCMFACCARSCVHPSTREHT